VTTFFLLIVIRSSDNFDEMATREAASAKKTSAPSLPEEGSNLPDSSHSNDSSAADSNPGEVAELRLQTMWF
jgi:hypothetical protein